MSESTMRGRVIRMLQPLDAIAVENPIRPGTPDVNYVHGWIELKHLRAWPKRSNDSFKPVLVPLFTQQQRRWLTRRAIYGGKVFLLLQVDREWLLFDGKEAAVHLGYVSRSRLYDIAIARWETGINEEELRTWLTSDSG